MDKNIENTIKTIDFKISKLNEYKTLLKSIDMNDKITEETWHELCHTDLRNCREVLHKFVKNTFEDATDISSSANYCSFNLYGFKCYIPTYDRFTIQLDMS